MMTLISCNLCPRGWITRLIGGYGIDWSWYECKRHGNCLQNSQGERAI